MWVGVGVGGVLGVCGVYCEEGMYVCTCTDAYTTILRNKKNTTTRTYLTPLSPIITHYHPPPRWPHESQHPSPPHPSTPPTGSTPPTVPLIPQQPPWPITDRRALSVVQSMEGGLLPCWGVACCPGSGLLVASVHGHRSHQLAQFKYADWWWWWWCGGGGGWEDVGGYNV